MYLQDYVDVAFCTILIMTIVTIFGVIGARIVLWMATGKKMTKRLNKMMRKMMKEAMEEMEDFVKKMEM